MYYVEIYSYKNCSTVKLYRTQKMAANQVNLDQVAFYRGYLEQRVVCTTLKFIVIKTVVR